jgi:4-amino-4-deoxy-L-arabinose transferase-like glycosyltransferase
LTGLLDALLAIAVAGVLNVAVVYNIRSRTQPSESGFLVQVFGWTMLLRYTVAAVLNVFVVDSAFAAAFWGDSGSYDSGGHQLSLKWSGEPITTAYMSTAVSGFGWVYFVGAIYYLFGRNQLLVQLLNGLIGGLTVLVIYAIAARLFDRSSARWAALFMAFFPQMVFWSTGMYKDPAVLLCIAVAIYAVVGLRDRLSLSRVGMFVVAEMVLITLRFYVAYFVTFAALATFVFTQRRGAVRMIFTYALLGALLFGALNVAVKRETLEQQATYLTFERLQVTREDQAMWGRSGFGQEYDVSTPAGALATLPVGLVYLLFAPFPWAVSGLRQALVVPETLVWYTLMPAFVRGLAYGLRRQFRAVLPIVVFAVSLTLAYALMQGNIGTAYRQRTQVTMFFFVFMAVGIVEKRRQRSVGTAPAGVPTALSRQP